MPRPNNPNLPEFYIYRLEFACVPFYVGIGRAGRAPMRLQFIRNCIARQQRGEKVKWARHCAVAAELSRGDLSLICIRYVAKHLRRAAALERERKEIDRLLRKDVVLANIHHNPERQKSAHDVCLAIKAHRRQSRERTAR